MSMTRRAKAAIRPVLLSRDGLVLLGLLLAIDAAFLFMHVAHLQARRVWATETFFFDNSFSIEQDGGHSESFELLKTLACAFALAGCWVRTRQPIYLALSVVFAYLFVDNALMVHETVGEGTAVLFSPAARLFDTAPAALGEVAFLGLVGLVVLGLVALALPRSTARHRLFGLAFVLLLLALGGFGVGVDLLHAVATAYSHRVVNWGFGVVEDGGELAILSVACALSLTLYAHLAAGRQPPGHAGAGQWRW